MTDYQASEKDRDYFRRLGKWKAETHEAARKAHLARPIGERLRISETLYQRGKGYARPTSPDRDAEALYERARKLGLYRS